MQTHLEERILEQLTKPLVKIRGVKLILGCGPHIAQSGLK